MTELAKACDILLRGGVGAIPTETVYGLAGDAARREAVERIYRVKGRPLDHPVIVHLAKADWIGRWAASVPPQAEKLISTFWPGPLTLVLPRARGVGDWLTGGQDTVAVRMPNHPLTLEMMRSCGLALAAPSANRFGRISPTTAQHVRDDLGSDIDFVLDGGPCEVGLESTIVDLSSPHPRILRPGRILPEQLEKILGPWRASNAQAPRVPGTLASHYAPTKQARYLENSESLEGAALLSFSPLDEYPGTPLAWERLPVDPEEAGRELYAALRRLDSSPGTPILIERPPAGATWEPVSDRLRRATGS